MVLMFLGEVNKLWDILRQFQHQQSLKIDPSNKLLITPHLVMNTNKPQNNSQIHQNQNSHSQEDNQYQISPQLNRAQGLHSLPVQESQDSDEGDILEKIDSLLEENQNSSIEEQSSNQNRLPERQMLLMIKINELQKIVQNLNQANKKLNRRVQEYEGLEHQQWQQSNQSRNRNNQSSSNMLNSSGESNGGFNDGLTEIQGDFQQIEGLIQEYKEQLARAEKKWEVMKEEKDEEIQSLKNEIMLVSQGRDVLQHSLAQSVQENQLLRNKNQQLLSEVENLEHELERRTESFSEQNYLSQASSSRYPSPLYETPARKFESFEDYRFNQKIQRQMEIMIKKLLKELSTQRKINSKMNSEIKRLSHQLIELEKKIKLKNDKIYHLEMKIISFEKTHNINNSHRKGFNIGTPTQNPTYNKHSALILNKGLNMTPTNKNQSQLYYASKPLNKQYQYIDQQQYDEQINQYQGDQYNDYVLTTLTAKSSRTHQKAKQNTVVAKNSYTSGGLVKNDAIGSLYKQNTAATEPNIFIKPKRRIETTNRQPKLHHQTLQSPNRSITKPQQQKQFLTFTLVQLQEGKIKITMRQKIIIISRIIDLYCKKIKNKNYYNLIAEEIQVYNFNEKHPNLTRIRIVDAHSNNSKGDISSTLQQDTEESLMYNLAFIVEILVKQVQTVDQKDLQVDLNLSEIIEEILTKSLQEKVAYFNELSKSLQSSVKTLE